jgi:hypothetical protein
MADWKTNPPIADGHYNVITPKPPAPRPESAQTTPEARQLTLVLMWFLLFLIVGTLLGVWIKLFWIGWVFLP